MAWREINYQTQIKIIRILFVVLRRCLVGLFSCWYIYPIPKNMYLNISIYWVNYLKAGLCLHCIFVSTLSLIVVFWPFCCGHWLTSFLAARMKCVGVVRGRRSRVGRRRRWNLLFLEPVGSSSRLRVSLLYVFYCCFLPIFPLLWPPQPHFRVVFVFFFSPTFFFLCFSVFCFSFGHFFLYFPVNLVVSHVSRIMKFATPYCLCVCVSPLCVCVGPAA